MYSTKQKDSKHFNKLLWTVGLLILAAALIAVLEFTDTTHLFHTRKPAVTASPDTKGEPSTGSSQPSSNSTTPGETPTTSPSDDKTSGNGNDTGAKLRQPTGDFVSSHHVSKKTPITSVCTTTPGANCKITFTQGGTVKSLEPRTTDRGGSAYWDQVSAESVGLGAGSWKIQAIATLGSQTETASDALDLEVSE